MKGFLLVAAVFIALATVANCENDYQSDCSYMWMMMHNSEPTMIGLSPWLLLGLGFVSLIISTTGPALQPTSTS